jgi:hypothetical protein
MITVDRYQIQAKETGKFLRTDFRSPGFAAGETPRPLQWLAYFEENPYSAQMWRREHALLLLADGRYPIQRERMRIVPAPRCGCCGSLWWRDAWSNSGPLKLVVDAIHPAAKVWRCEKHVGRNPCCIEGCGRPSRTRMTPGLRHHDHVRPVLAPGAEVDARSGEQDQKVGEAPRLDRPPLPPAPHGLARLPPLDRAGADGDDPARSRRAHAAAGRDGGRASEAGVVSEAEAR